MESRTDYGFIIIVCLAVAYIVIGILRLSGYIDNSKIILICSICSVIFAIISILETLVSGYKQAAKTVLSQIESKNKNSISPKIQNNYVNKVNWLHKIKNWLLFITMTSFFFLITTSWLNENPALADGLSLISFSLILFDIALKMYLEKVIAEFKNWLQQIKKGE